MVVTGVATMASPRAWEDSDGLVHAIFTPLLAEVAHTLCELRLAWSPGVWSDREVNCITCLAERGNFAGKLNEKPPPLLRREAGLFVFRWPFRTTGGLMHGVIVPVRYKPVMSTVYPTAPKDDVFTLCGMSVSAKLHKQTGRWTHGREPLTCLGCLACIERRPG